MRISTRPWYRLLSQSRLQRNTGSYLQSKTRQDFGRRFSDSSWLQTKTNTEFQRGALGRLIVTYLFIFYDEFFSILLLRIGTHTANVASPA